MRPQTPARVTALVAEPAAHPVGIRIGTADLGRPRVFDAGV